MVLFATIAGGAGHLAKMCYIRQAGKPRVPQTGHPIRAVADADSDKQDIWVNRLKLGVSHTNGSFDFHAFPDTGSAAKLIAADLAKQHNIMPTQPSRTKYVNVNGDPVPTVGTASVNLSCQSGRHVNTNAVITPVIRNEIIVGQDDLKSLGVISKQFPAPIFMMSEDRYSAVREKLIKEHPEVITDDLPENSMDTGCVSMRIHLTPGEKTPFRISTARQVPLHW